MARVTSTAAARSPAAGLKPDEQAGRPAGANWTDTIPLEIMGAWQQELPPPRARLELREMIEIYGAVLSYSH